MNIKPLASSSAGNAYLIDDGKTTLLLEAGIPYWKMIIKTMYMGIDEIAGALITHEHADHAKAVRELSRNGIDCYMTEGTKNAVHEDGRRIKVITEFVPFTVGTFEIYAFPTQHDAAQPIGYHIHSRETGENLLFATDTYYIRFVFKDLNYIMIECNYAKDILDENIKAGRIPQESSGRLMRAHFELENVKQFLKANDMSYVKHIYLLHLSSGNSDAKRFKTEIMKLTGKPVTVCEEKEV